MDFRIAWPRRFGGGGWADATLRARAVGRRKAARFAFQVFNRALNIRAHPGRILRGTLSAVKLVKLVSLKSSNSRHWPRAGEGVGG